jgi:hypothetical protein
MLMCAQAARNTSHLSRRGWAFYVLRRRRFYLCLRTQRFLCDRSRMERYREDTTSDAHSNFEYLCTGIYRPAFGQSEKRNYAARFVCQKSSFLELGGTIRCKRVGAALLSANSSVSHDKPVCSWLASPVFSPTAFSTMKTTAFSVSRQLCVIRMLRCNEKTHPAQISSL